MVLGMDFLLNQATCISFTEKEVKFHDGNIAPFIMNGSRNRLLNSIRNQKKVLRKEIFRLSEVIQLPAHSAKKIRVKTNLFPKGTMVQCTPEDLLKAIPHMSKVTMSAGIYTSDGNSMEVLVVNFGPTAVTLPKDKILGYMQDTSVELIPLDSKLDFGLKAKYQATPEVIQEALDKVKVGDLSPQDQEIFKALLGKYANLLLNNDLKGVIQKNVQHSIQT